MKVSILGLLCVLLLSCANAGQEQSAGTNVEGLQDRTAQVGTDDEPQTIDELMPYIPEALMEDLIVLQSAITYKFDEHMALCMSERGWETTQPVLRFLTVPAYESPAEQLLNELQNPSRLELDEQSGPRQASQAAREQEQLDFESCFESNEWKVSHPLAEGSEWYAAAYDAANERTNSNDGWRASLAAANACFEAEGYGTRAEAIEVLDSEYVTIAMDLSRSQDSEPSEEFITKLEDLVSRQRAIDELGDNCFASHQRLTTQTFHEYLALEVTGSPELQIEIAQMQQTVDRYRDVLDQLQELE